MLKIKKGYNLKILCLLFVAVCLSNNMGYGIDFSKSRNLRIPMQMSAKENGESVNLKLSRDDRTNFIFESLGDWFFERAKELASSKKRIEAIYLFLNAIESYKETLDEGIKDNPYAWPAKLKKLSHQSQESVSLIVTEIEKDGSLEEVFEIIKLSINTLRVDFNLPQDEVFKKMEKRIIQLTQPKKIEIDAKTGEPKLKEGDVIYEPSSGKVFSYIGIKESTLAQAKVGLPMDVYVVLGTGFNFYFGNLYWGKEQFTDVVKSGTYQFLTTEVKYKTEYASLVTDVIGIYEKLSKNMPIYYGHIVEVNLSSREFEMLESIIPSILNNVSLPPISVGHFKSSPSYLTWSERLKLAYILFSRFKTTEERRAILWQLRKYEGEPTNYRIGNTMYLLNLVKNNGELREILAGLFVLEGRLGISYQRICSIIREAKIKDIYEFRYSYHSLLDSAYNPKNEAIPELRQKLSYIYSQISL